MSRSTKAVWLYRIAVCLNAVAEVLLWPGYMVSELAMRVKQKAVWTMYPPRPMTGLWATLTPDEQLRILDGKDDV